MPPANSRAHSPLPVDAITSSGYLSALRQIDSIRVPDLASTLLNSQSYHDEDAADEANVSFLRRPLDSLEEWRAHTTERTNILLDIQHRQQERNREQLRVPHGDASSSASSTGVTMTGTGIGSPEDRARRERLQRVLNRLNRLHDPSSSALNAYGERIPQENSLYNWSPMGEQSQPRHSEEAAEDDHEGNDELRVERDIYRAGLIIYDGLRREQPNTHPDVLRATARARAREQIEAVRERYAARNRLPSSFSSRTQGTGSGGNGEAQVPAFPMGDLTQQHSVRRHPRFSARSREYMQRYVVDRERHQRVSEGLEMWREQASMSDQASRDEASSHSQQRTSSSSSQGSSRALRDHHPELQNNESSRGAYRRNYLEYPPRRLDASSVAQEPSLWLQHTITYLSSLRFCADHEHALSHAVDAGFATKEFLGEKQDDFLLDLDSVSRPPETSWLAPGAVFAGCQHATSTYPNSCPRETDRHLRSGEPSAQSNDGRTSGSEEPSGPRRRLHAQHGNNHTTSQYDTYTVRRASPPDQWPVKVIIHSVDYSNMTLAATMEAYNVPHHSPSYNSIISAANANAHPNGSPMDAEMSESADVGRPSAPQKTSSITTYLEGEIVDFATHSLLTESFSSDRRNDAMYWRKLEPFARLSSDDDMVRNLVSRRKLEELSSKYVLMRWKERCFIPRSPTSTLAAAQVPPTTADSGAGNASVWDGARPWMHSGDAVIAETGEGCGLTISGFYYVCLRRSDGAIEGLYCDPESSPYQRLRLNRAGGGIFPTWGFR